MPDDLLRRAVGANTLHVLPNGGNAGSRARMLLNASSWRQQLHAAVPSAQRIGLWSDGGVEVLWTKRDGASGVGTPCVGCSPLYAVVGGRPFFVWPTSERPRRVALDDDGAAGTSCTLRTLSERPRVLMAEGLLASAELSAIQRAGASRLQRSSTDWSLVAALGRLFGPRQPAHRTSRSAWLHVSDEASSSSSAASASSSDAALVQAAARRVASLARLSVAHSEPMQVVHYNTSEYYYYHLDNPDVGGGGGGGGGGRRRRQVPRVLTALFYLNDGFEGGHTNFPLSGGHWPPAGAAGRGAAAAQHATGGDHQPARAQDVLRAFGPCQTARGLSVRPKRGDVLLFYNAQPMTAAADYWPWHGSCEVTRGEKWAANLWFHAGTRTRTT